MSADRRATNRHETARRLFQRIDVGLQAVIIRTPGATLGGPVPLNSPTIIDLSATGACIQVQELDVAVADELTIAFTLDQLTYHALGVVLWVRPGPGLIAVHAGLRFEDMSEAEKTQLARHIMARKHGLPIRLSPGATAAGRRRAD